MSVSTCKFCGVAEGGPGRNDKPAHINNQGLCGPCYTFLEKVKYEDHKLTKDDWLWFEWMCKFNFEHGMFVPVAQRRRLEAEQPWRCKTCGQSSLQWRDKQYINYCVNCADEMRHNRNYTKRRKRRSDSGKPRKQYTT